MAGWRKGERMNRWGYDETRGTIVGGDHVTGTLHRYEDGAQVSAAFFGDNDAEVTELAKAWYEAQGGKAVWPNGLELRLI